MRAQISIPPSESAPRSDGPFDDEAFARWLERSAGNGPVGGITDFLARMSTFNLARVRIPIRQALAEQAFAVVRQTVCAFTQELIDGTIPVRVEQRNLIRDLDAALAAVATSYRIILHEQSRRLFGFASSGRALVPVQRMIELQGERLLLAHRTYRNPPKGCWREIHEQYQFAMRRGLARREIAAGYPTPDQIYKRLLLLAFADPRRFMQAEQDTVMRLVSDLAQLAEIRSARADADHAHLVLVKPHRDGPGFLHGKQRQGQIHPKDLYFDIDPVRRELDRRAAASTESTDVSAIAMRLARQWSTLQSRRHNRLRTQARVEVIAGLSPIWTYLQEHLLDAVHIGTWTITNESPNGFALAFQDGNVPLRVGEVVGVRAPGSTACHICVVRWLTTDEHDRLEMGLEELAPSARPAMIAPQPGLDAMERALLLPESGSTTSDPVLVAPFVAFSDPTELAVGEMRSRVRVRPGRVIERMATAQIVQFGAAD